MATKTIDIQIDTTDDAMVGGSGWENCDPRASVLKFKSQVLKRVAEAFPGYDIEIEETDHANSVNITDERVEDVELRSIEEDHQAVRLIISDVWEAADWYV